MNALKYKYILYVIAVVILCTIGIQVYWNYKNYNNNKQQLVNDVQTSLDNAVNRYYEGLAKETTFSLAVGTSSEDDPFLKQNSIDSVLKCMDSTRRKLMKFNENDTSAITSINFMKGQQGDSLLKRIEMIESLKHSDSLINRQWSAEFSTNQILTQDIGILTSKVFVSIVNDSLNLKSIDSLVRLELDRKNLTVDFYLDFKNQGHHIDVVENQENNAGPEKNQKSATYLSTNSESTFLPHGSLLTIMFTNTTKVILNRMLGGIIISTLLILAVISCLFYLLKIIRHQKQLAEVKNDLISNITHEFKTPIATISVALESIKNFNAIESKEKTMNYLDMSSDQLSKLNVMVEKLLETSTLDSENLELNKDHTNIVELIQQLIDKHNMQKTGQQIQFVSSSESIIAIVDPFHFENAINNILDNAVKYGGQDISVEITKHQAYISISISDSGTSLNKINKDKIFEKFYRVPKGNTHDVKGFGIGLYYTKKIIEKHDGTIQLLLADTSTTFQIALSNA